MVLVQPGLRLKYDFTFVLYKNQFFTRMAGHSAFISKTLRLDLFKLMLKL